jgi:hypothetical protein
MKRILLWLGFPNAMLRVWGPVALLAFMPVIAEAYYYSSYGCGVHYSPYALSYYHSGLVPGGVDYSPYALNYEGSGLVYAGAQYTPYAFNYYSSGLIPGYGVYSETYPIFSVHPMRVSPIVRRLPPAVHLRAQDTRRTTRPQDGMDVIRQHLQAKGFASVSINRILRIDGQLVSVDFFVKDRNLLIKYWNPEEVQRLNAKEAFKQKACEKYKQDWESFAKQYTQGGGEIYYVNASEPQTIVAALESCTKLGPGNGGQTQPVLYAKD